MNARSSRLCRMGVVWVVGIFTSSLRPLYLLTRRRGANAAHYGSGSIRLFFIIAYFVLFNPAAPRSRGLDLVGARLPSLERSED